MIAHCHKTNTQLPFHIDIVGFGDEEGTRFGSTLLGSRALLGNWPREWAELKDAAGVTLRQALRDFGLDFDAVNHSHIAADTLHGYVELHIEQGPILEQQNLAVGVVSAIAGARRLSVEVTGFAGHAGTVPMGLRQDALAAASEMVLAVERIATAQGIVATVGKITNRPNGVNVVAGNTHFSLDIRSDSDTLRDQALQQMLLAFDAIAQTRGVRVTHTQTHSAPAVVCSDALQAQLTKAVTAHQGQSLTLLSGAGHDAMAMAELCPVAMLFTRCHRGISHHPAESISLDDVEVSLRTLYTFVNDFQAVKS